MAPDRVSPPLRYGSTCPVVGVADASETSASGARFARLSRMSHPRRWRISGPRGEADAAPPENAPSGAFSGAPVDAAQPLRAARTSPKGGTRIVFDVVVPRAATPGPGGIISVMPSRMGSTDAGQHASRPRGRGWPARGDARQRQTDTCNCTYLHPCRYASQERKAQAARNFVGFQR